MKYLAIALILLSGLVFAHTVTLNFAARVGTANNSLHVNGTSYDPTTPLNVNFSNLSGGYVSINKSVTMATIISAGTLLNSAVNNTYYHKLENGDTVMVLHMDN